MGELFDYVCEPFTDNTDVVWAIHAHNHLGGAVDNVFTAIDHGVRQVEGTLAGIGPSGGNTDLLEVLARLPAGQRHECIDSESLRQII